MAQLFKQNLAVQAATSSKSGISTDGDGVVTMTQDLLQVLLPYLGEKDAQTLFELSSTEDVLENKDTGVQKRGYKILGKLAESGKIEMTPENFIRQLEGKVDGVSAAAKKVRAHYIIRFSWPPHENLQDRLHLLALLVNILPDTSLHLLPSLIPEAVLGTKEPSEKARLEAFDLIVTMGKKMKKGGVVKRNLLEGIDEDDATESTSLIKVFFNPDQSTVPCSTRILGRVLYDDCWWSRGCYSSYDQCDDHRYLPADFRVQRSGFLPARRSVSC